MVLAHPSGLPGPKGNLETFVWLAQSGRPAPPRAMSRCVVWAQGVEG